jgi:hypothetical protein
MLSVLPLAPGLPLSRAGEGEPTMVPLVDAEPPRWWRASADAPILFVVQADGDASFVRYPTAPRDALALVRLAEISELPTLAQPEVQTLCVSASECRSSFALDPDGQLAVAEVEGAYLEIDRRAGAARALALPEPLQAAPGLGLLGLLDRSVSVWISAGQVFRWDHTTGQLDSEKLFARPPFVWTPVERGRALTLLASDGTLLRIDGTRIAAVHDETTDCIPTSLPVVSPGGRWAAWTCVDAELDAPAPALLVRASAAGIEAFAGIPTMALAIDDHGELLLASLESEFTDVVDGIAPSLRPRNLFVLSSTGVLTRIDELEPAPAPVEIGAIAVYLQAQALD